MDNNFYGYSLEELDEATNLLRLPDFSKHVYFNPIFTKDERWALSIVLSFTENFIKKNNKGEYDNEDKDRL